MDSQNPHTTFSMQNSLQKLHLADSTPRCSLSFSELPQVLPQLLLSNPRTALHIGSLQTDSDEL